MIANIINGSRFHFSYLENKNVEEKGKLIDCNFLYDKTDGNDYIAIKNVFKDVVYSNKNVRKFDSNIFHVSLSLNSFENLSDEKFISLAYDYLNGLGIDQNRPISIYRHNDNGKPHIHILTTKINYDGKKINESHIKRKSMRLSRNLEVKYNLKVTEYKKGEKKKFNEIKAKKRNKSYVIYKDVIKEHITHFSNITSSFEEFKSKLENKGIKVNKIESSKGFNLYFSYNGYKFRDNKLGRNYNYFYLSNKIENTLLFSEKEQKYFLTKNIEYSLKKSLSYENFVKDLERKNIKVIEHKNSSGIYGISFKSNIIDNPIEFKGSQLDYSYNNIVNQLKNNNIIKSETYTEKLFEQPGPINSTYYIDDGYFKPYRSSTYNEDENIDINKKKKKKRKYNGYR